MTYAAMPDPIVNLTRDVFALWRRFYWLPEWAVIGRAGASTVSELAVAGLPSIVIPLKIATDDHQRANAKLLADAGAAWVITEDDLTVDSLTGAVQSLLANASGLAARAAAARSVAMPDAVKRLADIVERTAASG